MLAVVARLDGDRSRDRLLRFVAHTHGRLTDRAQRLGRARADVTRYGGVDSILHHYNGRVTEIPAPHAPPSPRKSGVLKGCLITAFVSVIVLLGGFFLLVRLNAPEPLPTDQELITKFQQNRADFDRLWQLVEERGSQLGLDPDQAPPQPANAAEAEMLALLQKLGIRYGVHLYQNPVLVVGSEGNRLAAFQKGYTFRTKPPVNDDVRRVRVANNLDAQTDPTTQWTSYRPIGDGWYLYMIGGD